jgi:hypothetical protein
MTLACETTSDVVPLDEIATRERLQPDVLKTDVQGAGRQVLQGVVRTIADAARLEQEVELNPQSQGQPLFGEVDVYLSSQGFTLLRVQWAFWRRKFVGGDRPFGCRRLVAQELSTAHNWRFPGSQPAK